MERSDKPAVVLDTNVVLDWRVFADPRMPALRSALEGGALRWIATTAMLDELADVLQRTAFERWSGAAADALAFARGTAQLCDPPVVPRAGHPTCRDPDDQKFIDLALAMPARWLVTRDKALLALRRQAAARGVWIGTPADWAPG